MNQRPDIGLPPWRLLIGHWPLALSAGAGAMLAFAALGRPRFVRRNRVLSLATLGTAALLGAARWQLERLFNDGPSYEVERREGSVEIRRYASQMAAETSIENAGFEDALNEGFRRLAGYIFGGNRGQGGGETIAMTSPVIFWRDPIGTAAVRFWMPRVRAASGSLPAPADPRVELKEVPGRRVAVIRYHGRYRANLEQSKERELLAAVKRAGLEMRGPVFFAGYDPPWTLPALRRVEVQVEIA